MKKHVNFLGVSLIISAFLISVSLVFSALANRYYVGNFSGGYESVFVFDKLTGAYYGFFKDKDGYQKLHKIDIVKKADK